LLAVAGIGALGNRTGGVAGDLGGATPVFAQSDQIAAGQQVYRQICASCHGDQGEGIDDAPPLFGAGTQIGDYRTANRLHSFIASEMPGDDPGSLSQQQVYDVLAYILSENGLNPGGLVVDQSSAANISLNP
jgi:cytochrome c